MEIGEGANTNSPVLSNEPCTIKSLSVICGHGRKAYRGRLQVVAERTFEEVLERESFGVKVEVKKEDRGKETLTATVETMDGSEPKHVCCGKSPEEGTWKNSPAKLEIENPLAEDNLWTMDAPPTIYFITGRGCDDSVQTIRVDAFTNVMYTGTLTLNPNYDVIEEVLDAVEKLIKILFSTSPATAEWTKELKPKGVASICWGWEEDERNWKAYFLFKATFGIDPIFVLGVDVDISLLSAAGMLVGIPPAIMKIIGKHLADILINLGLELSSRLVGSVEARIYNVGKPENHGGVELALTGTGKVEVSVRYGSDYLLSFKLTGGGTSGIEGTAKLEIQPMGLFYTPRAEILPLQAYVTVRTRSFYFFGPPDATKKWKLWDGCEFYKPEAKQLWPPAMKKPRKGSK